MSNVVLVAKNRQEKGSAVARRLRRGGRIPGILYGRSGTSIPLDLDEVEFTKGIKGITESTIVKVEVDGKGHDVFVKDMQRNIMDGKVLHVDFYEIEKDVLLHAKVQLVIQGNPVGVREGGILELPHHDIVVECLPKNLPERIFVDISELKTGHSIHVRDLPLDKAVKLISAGDNVVALVKFPKGAAAEVEVAADAAAPAPAAAAAPEEKKV
ncbi:MAG: 50S ribosomal protein L25 [Treponema sp.]|nr:50S ribosomal protein L25 [Treponema sp.]